MLKLLHITDTHLLGEPGAQYREMDTRASLAQVLAQAQAAPLAPYDAVVLGGDISEDQSPASYRFIAQALQPLGIPILSVPGNHDDPERMREHLNSGAFQFTGVFELPHWKVLLLDSFKPGRVDGRLSASSLALLREQLAAPDPHHLLLCLHHHPVDVGSDWLDTIGLSNADELFAAIDPHTRVRGILWGHVHQAFAATRNGVRLLSSPSTCRQFMPRAADFALDVRPPGARQLCLHDDGRIESHLIWSPQHAG